MEYKESLVHLIRLAAENETKAHAIGDPPINEVGFYVDTALDYYTKAANFATSKGFVEEAIDCYKNCIGLADIAIKYYEKELEEDKKRRKEHKKMGLTNYDLNLKNRTLEDRAKQLERYRQILQECKNKISVPNFSNKSEPAN